MSKMYKSIPALKELSIEQENALELLLTGASDAAVAESVGVSRQTVLNWRHNSPEFRAELSRRRASIYAECSDALRALVPDAIAVLRTQLKSEDARVQLKAASQVLKAAGLDTGVEPVAKSAQSIQLDEALISW
jgi:hypothetical protein